MGSILHDAAVERYCLGLRGSPLRVAAALTVDLVRALDGRGAMLTPIEARSLAVEPLVVADVIEGKVWV